MSKWKWESRFGRMKMGDRSPTYRRLKRGDTVRIVGSQPQQAFWNQSSERADLHHVHWLIKRGIVKRVFLNNLVSDVTYVPEPSQ